MPALVIGYGNTLRGDDGLGPRIAEVLAAKRLPHVEVIVTHQLLPELAERLAAASLAIFIDAYPAAVGDSVRVEALGLKDDADSLAHTTHPGALLALAQAAYLRAPQAWWVQVPGFAFAMQEALSPQAAAALEPALHCVIDLLAASARPPSMDRTCASR